MQSTPNITCPACAMKNDDQERCSFCGTSLRAAQPQPPAPGHIAAAGPTSAPPQYQNMAGSGPVPNLQNRPEPWQQGPSLSPKFAGFWIRSIAFLCDSFLIQLIIWILVAVSFFGYITGSGKGPSLDQASLLFELPWGSLAGVDLIVSLSYFTFFLGRTGQTPGKMLFSLKVLRRDGKGISYPQALVRTIGYYLNHLTLGIGFLWIAVDRRKQGFHDKIAGTVEICLGQAQIRDWHPPLSPPE